MTDPPTTKDARALDDRQVGTLAAQEIHTRGREARSGTPAGWTRLAGGLNNEVFLARVGTQRVCVKVFAGARAPYARREWWALTTLSDAGLLLAPRPLAFEADEEQATIIMELLEGAPRVEPATPNDLPAIADALSQLYGIALSGLGVPPGPAVGSAQAIVERVRTAWAELTAPRFDPVRDRARALGRMWLESDGPACVLGDGTPILSRGDGNLVNWLKTNRGLRLVDFEYSGMSERAFDIGDFMSHPSTAEVSETQWERFSERLDLTPVERRRTLETRRLFVFFWIMKFWGDPTPDRLEARLAHGAGVLGLR